MDQTDRDLLAELERGLPVTREPFAGIGSRLGIPESEVLERLQRLRSEGVIRRFRARIDQRKLGILANALVAWHVRAGPDRRRRCPSRPVPGSHPLLRTAPGYRAVGLHTLYRSPRGHRQDVTAEVKRCAEMSGLDEYYVTSSKHRDTHVSRRRVRENGGRLAMNRITQCLHGGAPSAA